MASRGVRVVALALVLGFASLLACNKSVGPPLGKYVKVPLERHPMVGAVNPTAGRWGDIPAEGKAFRTNMNLGKTYSVNRSKFSKRFAEVLVREYQARGVAIGRGPELVVQVTRLAMKRRRMRGYECFLSIIVHLAGQQLAIDGGGRDGRKDRCRTRAFEDVVARIITHPTIYQRISQAR